MDRQEKSLIILVCINILIPSLVQAICWLMLSEKINMSFFQFVVFPLIFLFINIAITIKIKTKFYQYAFSAYVGFFCSIIVWSIILLIFQRPEELPPGEIVLFADVLLIFLVSVVQFVILSLINLVVYIVFKIFFSKRLLKQT